MTTIKSNNSIYATGSKSSTYFCDKLMKEINSLNKRIDKLEKENRKLRAENRRLKAENKELRNENQRLRSIIANNSSNSSLPPSSDQKPSKQKAPNEYNSRTKTNKCPGGQPGHFGITLTREHATQLIQKKQAKHKVIYANDLSFIDRHVRRKYRSYYVIDLEITPTVTEYRIPVNVDIANYIPANLAAKLRSGTCYGNTVRTLAIELATTHAVSITRTQSFINSCSNGVLNLSTGVIGNFLTDFATLCNTSGAIDYIKDDLRHSKVLCTDGTNVTVNGMQEFIRNQSNAMSVLYCPMQDKTVASIGASGVIGEYSGILVHDHEVAVYHYGIDHAECGAHILRYLKKVKEEMGNTWATNMIHFLTNLNQYKQSLIEQNINAISENCLIKYCNRYEEILEEGLVQNKSSTNKPRYARKNEEILLTRMKKYENNHLLFIYDFDVPFTNNMSERDLRKCKNKQKISGGFRKQSGKQTYCTIMSVIETMKRRGINPFVGIRQMLDGKKVIC